MCGRREGIGSRESEREAGCGSGGRRKKEEVKVRKKENISH